MIGLMSIHFHTPWSFAAEALRDGGAALFSPDPLEQAPSADGMARLLDGGGSGLRDARMTGSAAVARAFAELAESPSERRLQIATLAAHRVQEWRGEIGAPLVAMLTGAGDGEYPSRADLARSLLAAAAAAEELHRRTIAGEVASLSPRRTFVVLARAYSIARGKGANQEPPVSGTPGTADAAAAAFLMALRSFTAQHVRSAQAAAGALAWHDERIGGPLLDATRGRVVPAQLAEGLRRSANAAYAEWRLTERELSAQPPIRRPLLGPASYARGLRERAVRPPLRQAR